MDKGVYFGLQNTLTYEQKKKAEGVLNGDLGIKIWNKQSLSPDSRITSALLLVGDKDTDKLLARIPALERNVIRAVQRESSRSRGKGKGFEK